MNKPELLLTPTSVDDIIPLSEAGADSFVIGEERFGLRLAGEFSKEDVKKAIQLAHSKNKKVYVAMTGLFHNDKVDEVEQYLKFVHEAGADAVLFGDPAIIMARKTLGIDIPLHWDPHTLATNWYTCNYWGKKGAKRAVLSKELSMDEIIEIKENAEVEVEVQIHGMTCMFQSRRPLVHNYFEYQGKKLKVEEEKGKLYLFDPDRDNYYPVFEDSNGTHIMSPNDMCIIDELQELVEAGIDCFKIDGILKSPEYLIEVTKLYRKAIDLCVTDVDEYEDIADELLERIEEIQPESRPLDTGFFFKETVY
ncbi:peptidase U32 family protein [Pallidibacillus pasinlerensis]|uniref:U32 family peptidase n=1 Tax=Pallidibacillus pasinlerensis TaxID=2703818 RepID=A0ABX0A228_9BACI|nr:peptidase U32 family protein [Pallidibacillus pasinlerensis]NCU17495.1 U32 family peptidase [Pallidibacillus pasinlerensis]